MISLANAKLAKAKTKRTSATRKTISFAPPEDSSEIAPEDFKKMKCKVEKSVASENGMFYSVI